MILCVTPQDLESAPSQAGGRLIQMFGDRKVPWDGPCGHLVRQLPEDDNGPHFHEADQYQIFIAGEGQVGGHAVGPGSIHYADGYAGYGPIITPEGCTYYTLRSAHDVSRHLLPTEAALTRGRKARQKVAELVSARIESGALPLFEREDGVAVHQVDAAPGEPLAEVPASGGCYWVIMAGSAQADGREIPSGSCLWIGEGENRPALVAGPDGARAAVLAFAPARSQAERGARTWTAA